MGALHSKPLLTSVLQFAAESSGECARRARISVTRESKDPATQSLEGDLSWCTPYSQGFSKLLLLSFVSREGSADLGSALVKSRGNLSGSALGMFRTHPRGKTSWFGVFGVGRMFGGILRKWEMHLFCFVSKLPQRQRNHWGLQSHGLVHVVSCWGPLGCLCRAEGSRAATYLELFLEADPPRGRLWGRLFSSRTQKLVHLFGRGLLIKQENFKPEWFLKGNVLNLHPKAFLLHNPNQTFTMKLLLWVSVLPPPLSCSVTHQEQGVLPGCKSTFHCSFLPLPIWL